MAEPAEMVEVVIRLPKEIYERTLRTGVVEVGMDSAYIGGAVIDGTVLPKGHGKIIAEPTEEDIAKTIGGQNDFAECIREAVKAVFDNAPTIIEADTEREDKNDSTRDGIEE